VSALVSAAEERPLFLSSALPSPFFARSSSTFWTSFFSPNGRPFLGHDPFCGGFLDLWSSPPVSICFLCPRPSLISYELSVFFFFPLAWTFLLGPPLRLESWEFFFLAVLFTLPSFFPVAVPVVLFFFSFLSSSVAFFSRRCRCLNLVVVGPRPLRHRWIVGPCRRSRVSFRFLFFLFVPLFESRNDPFFHNFL